jgi:purine catabolism regulator
MGLTLQEVLSWDILEDSVVVVPASDNQNQVESITIMEAPDIGRWVDKNSIVLTGLYAVNNDRRKLAEFIDSLASRNICALFIKTNRFVTEVPQLILSAAARYGVAVVEIPADLRYVDILYPVMAALFKNKIIKLSYYKQTLNALSGLVLTDKGMKEIAHSFADIIHNPVLIFDADMECLLATDDEYRVVSSREQIGVFRSDDLDYIRNKVSFANQSRRFEELMISLQVFGQTKAYLSIIEANRSMSELDYIALENAVSVFSFDLVRNFAEERIEGRFKDEIIDDIKHNRNLDSLKERMESVGLDSTKKYCVLIVELPTNPINKTPAIVKQRLVDNNAAKAYNTFLATKSVLSFKGFENHHTNRIIAFIQQPALDDLSCERLLERFCREYIDRLQNLLPDFPIHIGYESTCLDIVQSSRLFQNADAAIRVSNLILGENSYCNYDNLGIYKLLSFAQDREDLENLIPRSVKLLNEYEQKTGLALIETLVAYFKNNGNARQTAEALFVHYKTLHYRLSKVQSVAQINLKDSNQLFELQMGLMILQMLDKS